MDTTHLNALELRLSHERERLAKAKTNGEREMRAVWVAGIEKEISQELAFLGRTEELPEMSDEELLKALTEQS
jgi:hypothetical protein